jgi:hypothetical protein
LDIEKRRGNRSFRGISPIQLSRQNLVCPCIYIRAS